MPTVINITKSIIRKTAKVIKDAASGSIDIENKSADSLLSLLISSLVIVLAIGSAFFLMSVAATIINQNLYLREVCLHSRCIVNFYDEFSGSIKIIIITSKTLTMLATCGGIIVAILGYLNNAQSSALGNHIAHLSVFSHYVRSEIDKLDKLNPSSFDILLWYNLIFSESKKGMTKISKGYIETMKRINGEIYFSNKQASKAKEGSFRYKNHQERMIRALKEIGVSISFMPRKDFFDAEGQVLDLVCTINKSFCVGQNVPEPCERRYI